MSGDGQVTREDRERRELRPYRRFVIALFALAIAVLCGFVLRGIVRTLDRLPSSAGLYRPDRVDDRALRACGEDLERLEARVRRAAGEALGRGPEARGSDRAWAAVATKLELERLGVVARCHLEEPGQDPAQQALAGAAERLEALVGVYGLLVAREEREALPESEALRRALERAAAVLDARR